MILQNIFLLDEIIKKQKLKQLHIKQLNIYHKYTIQQYNKMTEERKVALITGVTGQDGSYLTELLLEKGYTVSFSWK